MERSWAWVAYSHSNSRRQFEFFCSGLCWLFLWKLAYRMRCFLKFCTWRTRLIVRDLFMAKVSSGIASLICFLLHCGLSFLTYSPGILWCWKVDSLELLLFRFSPSASSCLWYDAALRYSWLPVSNHWIKWKEFRSILHFLRFGWWF